MTAPCPILFPSEQSSSSPARGARLTDDSQHLCYAAVTDEGIRIAIFSLRICLRDPPSTPPIGHTHRNTQRLTDSPWKLHSMWVHYYYFIQSLHFPPFSHKSKAMTDATNQESWSGLLPRLFSHWKTKRPVFDISLTIFLHWDNLNYYIVEIVWCF